MQNLVTLTERLVRFALEGGHELHCWCQNRYLGQLTGWDNYQGDAIIRPPQGGELIRAYIYLPRVGVCAWHDQEALLAYRDAAFTERTRQAYELARELKALQYHQDIEEDVKPLGKPSGKPLGKPKD